jgi:hypothetical protein
MNHYTPNVFVRRARRPLHASERYEKLLRFEMLAGPSATQDFVPFAVCLLASEPAK